MLKCETCGNEYDKAFTVVMDGESHAFDSFECAIERLAPVKSSIGGHWRTPPAKMPLAILEFNSPRLHFLSLHSLDSGAAVRAHPLRAPSAACPGRFPRIGNGSTIRLSPPM